MAGAETEIAERGRLVCIEHFADSQEKTCNLGSARSAADRARGIEGVQRADVNSGYQEVARDGSSARDSCGTDDRRSVPGKFACPNSMAVGLTDGAQSRTQLPALAH